jgi:hypothetical protein
LLLHTVMLVGLGIVAGAKVKDSRTARTFMLLALGAIPINFGITGGFLYSQFALDTKASLPFGATWLAPSPMMALLIAGRGSPRFRPPACGPFSTPSARG